MSCGDIELVSVNNQDSFLIGNPKITFLKSL